MKGKNMRSKLSQAMLILIVTLLSNIIFAQDGLTIKELKSPEGVWKAAGQEDDIASWILKLEKKKKGKWGGYLNDGKGKYKFKISDYSLRFNYFKFR